MVVRRNKIAPVQMNFLALFLPTFPLVMCRAITKGSKGCVAFYAGPQQMLLCVPTRYCTVRCEFWRHIIHRGAIIHQIQLQRYAPF